MDGVGCVDGDLVLDTRHIDAHAVAGDHDIVSDSADADAAPIAGDGPDFADAGHSDVFTRRRGRH